MNEVIIVFLSFLCVLFTALSIIFYFKYKKFKAKFNSRPDTYDVTELMHDLTKGNAILEIRRIDPSSIFKRML